MSSEKLKKKIKKKFGTFSRFCVLAGISRYDFQLKLAVKNKDEEFLKKLESLCESLNNTPTDSEMTYERRMALKKAIDIEGGVSAYAKKKGYPISSVWNVLQGERKKSKLSRELMDNFGIE